MNVEKMLAAYIRCALWSSNDESDEQGGQPLDKNYSQDDIHKKTIDRMRADCEAFLAANEKDIGEGYTRAGFDVHEHAGHDLWLTRNGHGAGFWDGDWPEPEGKRLTDAAQAMGQFDLYVGDDGVIYGTGCEP